MPNRKRRLLSPWGVLILALLGLAALAAACDSSVPDPNVAATARALSTLLPATATARATAIPNPYAQLQTAQAQATQVAVHAQATLSARRTQQALQGNATAQAFAPVMAELPYFGVDPDAEGHPGWVHPPLTLTAKGYHTATYGNQYPQTVMRDGVLSSKITWDTKYGSGGCGFVVRANGNEQAPSEYVILMMRSSQLLFTVIKDGELANLRVLFIRDHDRQFDWHNGATNQLTVVLRDNRIALYTNHALHKVLDPNARPSLYLPLLIPPDKAVNPPELPPPPEAAANPSSGDANALRAYVAQVDERLAAYLDTLDGMIARLNGTVIPGPVV